MDGNDGIADHPGVPTTRTIATSQAPVALLDEIRRLLDAAFAGAFSDDDWEHTIGGRHVVVAEGAHVLAHAAVVARTLDVDGRPFATGYVEGVAAVADRRGQGLGSLVMAEATGLIRGTFEFGALSTDRHGFYERLGWERWRGPTFVRHGSALVRTEDEDDGVMVLRFGPSLDVDLEGSISCESRHGDAW